MLYVIKPARSGDRLLQLEHQNHRQSYTMAVWRAAEATIDTLRDIGIEHMCFIGGLAAKLYGNDREPNVSVVARLGRRFADSWLNN